METITTDRPCRKCGEPCDTLPGMEGLTPGLCSGCDDTAPTARTDDSEPETGNAGLTESPELFS